ncbi:hypothetical protein MTP03_27760 [Tsukamurella sp. PLM1]|nr:hypothetical protein MTP03_27760 [Tsukamurella sp. PLM1]
MAQSVPAVVHGGTSTGTTYSSVSGTAFTGSGVVPVWGGGVSTVRSQSALAAELDRAPARPRTGTGLGITGVVLVVIAALFCIPAVLTVSSVPPDAIFAAYVVGAFAMPALLAGTRAALFYAVYRSQKRLGRYREAELVAYPIWEAGWYCHRCHACWWPRQVAGHVPPGVAVPPPVFSSYVWAHWRG